LTSQRGVPGETGMEAASLRRGMSFGSVRALFAGCLFGALVCACAGRHPAPEPPAEANAPADDQRAQLLQSLEALKQAGVRAEQDTRAARSVLDAIVGSPQMQGDGGVTAE
jgi:uncharacterized membrane protein